MGKVKVNKTFLLELIDRFIELGCCSCCPARYVCNENPDISCNETVMRYLQAEDMEDDGWFSIKGKPPEIETPILISDGDIVTIGCLNSEGEIESDRYEFIYMDNVTKWKPLPEPPKVNKRKGKL